MEENIRKIVEAAKKSPQAAERLGARLGIREPESPTPLYPRQNGAKSVAKARKKHQVTTSQHQPHQ